MRREDLDEVLRELGSFITEELVTTRVAIGCLRVVAHRALSEFEASDDQEQTRLLGADVPGSGWVAALYGVAGAQALVADAAEGGRTHSRLTQQWIVTVYTGWEATFRRRIATAHGVDEAAIQADFFGDLRHLRNDIVHNRGLASREHSSKCSVALRRELRPGDPIYLQDDELQWMHLAVPWAKLTQRPVS